MPRLSSYFKMISTGSGILRRTLQSCNASLQKTHIQRLSTKANVPPRKKVFKEERTAQRQARREQAVQSMEGSANTSSKAAPAVPAKKPIDSRIAFGLGVGVPTALLAWGIADEESPPAQFAKMIGLTGLIEGYGDTFARPSRDKLLPDWPVSYYISSLHCRKQMKKVQLNIVDTLIHPLTTYCRSLIFQFLDA